MVNGLELVAQPRPDPVCVPCLAGKMNANSFPSSLNRSTTPLERIHSDLHELKTLTTSGFRYWVTFIDDAPGHHAVIFLKKKSDAFDAFRAFKAYAENLLGAKIKELQMDQGGEFVSNAFRLFCSNAGILMRFATRKRSQQNGVAERANRTMDEHTTAMLAECGLPPSFKGEAIRLRTEQQVTDSAESVEGSADRRWTIDSTNCSTMSKTIGRSSCVQASLYTKEQGKRPD